MYDLVTGASGYIGGHLVKELLKHNKKVIILHREQSDVALFRHSNLKLIKLNGDYSNINDELNYLKIDTAYHLATHYMVEHCYNDISKMVDSNILFSTMLLESIKSKNCSFVNVSTTWEYYTGGNREAVNLYAATKKAFKQIMDFYSCAYEFNSMNLLLTDTYGEDDTRPKLLNLLKNKEGEMDLSLGEQEFDLLHIDDVVKGLIRAGEYLKENTGFYEYKLGSKTVHTLKQVLDRFVDENSLNIKINWGAKPYRDREVMNVVDDVPILPGWKTREVLF